MINGAASSWTPVTLTVTQRLAIAPLFFIIYIDDVEYGSISMILKLTDDTKLNSNIVLDTNV